MSPKISIPFLVVLTCAIYSIGCNDEHAPATQQTNAAESSQLAPRERIIAILDERDRLQRVEKLIAALRAIPASEVGELRDVLRTSDLGFRELERVLVVARWAQDDPVGASQWAMRGERGAAKNAAIREAVQVWASRDPEAVIQTYEVEKLGNKIPALLTAVIAGWFDSGVPGVGNYVLYLGDPDVRTRGLAELARVIVSRQGSEAAIAWVEGIKESEVFKNVPYRMVASEVAKVDPEVAVEWCARVCDLEVGKSMSQAITRSWGPRGGSEMMTWLLSRPDIQETWVAARIGFREFLMRDEEAAAAWMESTTPEQRASAILQGPIAMYANKLGWDDPLAAFGWTEHLTSGMERRNLRISLTVRWMRIDRAAAEAWLEQSDMNEEDRRKTYKILGDPKGNRDAAD